jgi:hypothetical protein
MERKTSYSTSHQKYYTEHKDEINERRKAYAKEHQRLYREKLRATLPPEKIKGRGRPRKTDGSSATI